MTLDSLDGHDGKREIDAVWIDEGVAPPVVHRLTLFDARGCPSFPGDETVWHIFGGAETVCGIVVAEPTGKGNHFELVEEDPDVDCNRCLTIEGLRDPSLVVELTDPVSA